MSYPPPYRENTWTCKRHAIGGLTTHCPRCLEAFDQRTPATEMTWPQRAQVLRDLPEQLTIPFDSLHKWIEELVGRPVWTHELGTVGFAALIEEVESGHPDPANMRASLPRDKTILLVDSEEDQPSSDGED
jgi:hypothetical protein